MLLASAIPTNIPTKEFGISILFGISISSFLQKLLDILEKLIHIDIKLHLSVNTRNNNNK